LFKITLSLVLVFSTTTFKFLSIYIDKLKCHLIDETTGTDVGLTDIERISPVYNGLNIDFSWFGSSASDAKDISGITVVDVRGNSTSSSAVKTPIIRSIGNPAKRCQLLSPTDNNLFMLTNLADTNTIQTKFYSLSAKIDTNTPYSGLFKAKLTGDAFKHWFKLTTEYFD
jgi:hypothetical protein